MSKNKWQITDGDIDFRTSVRFISGKITKKRWKFLDGFCRRKSYAAHCGCSHDCCGCVSSECYTLERVRGGVKLTYSVHFNY